MAKCSDSGLAGLLQFLCDDSSARLVDTGDGRCRLVAAARSRAVPISKDQLKDLVARGLLVEAEPKKFGASDSAHTWLKRRPGGGQDFRAQHGEIVAARVAGDPDSEALVNLDESPIAALARRPAKNGAPWLSPDLTVAAERLRRDFEVGRLQPRVTANWSASVNRGRRTGNTEGLTDLTDMALAARLRVDRAMDAVGPELSGVLVDVCCFLKGLETVERERQWPARSAKLVLKIALERLARHYGLAPAATGKSASGELRHWGANDYRPSIA